MSLTATLAEAAIATDAARLPDALVVQAKRALLDTLACGLAGWREPGTQALIGLVAELGGREQATVWGGGPPVSVADAALINGASAHALDFDDVIASLGGHPSVPVAPAALALGEYVGASGRDVLAAFAVGVEFECKVARAIGPSHYARGWHATSTMGVLGAAAAAGRLLGLDVRQMTMAIGIAASQASGLRLNFGTMTKPFHPGHAARAGVVAALLARRGFTADADVLDGPLGFLLAFSPDRDVDLEAAGWGEPWELCAPAVSVKKYPCCFQTHRALDAVLALRAEHGLAAADVTSVAVRMPPGASVALIHPRPGTGLEGKFSMEYTVAAALLDGRVGLASFEDAAVQRDAAQALIPRVTTTVDDAPPVGPAEGYADVAVTLGDGRALRRRVEEPRGGPDEPLTWDELAAKFRDCAESVLTRDAAERTLATVAALDQQPDLGLLMAALSGRVVGAPAR